MNLNYVIVKQEDLPNIFSMVRTDDLPHFSIPVTRIVETATLGKDTDVLPPFDVVRLNNGEWRVLNRNGEEVEIHGFIGPIPNYILTEDVAKSIAQKFNSKWWVR